MLTTDRDDPRLTHGIDTEPVAQAEVYLVLSEEERANGFVRPLRFSYRHVGAAGHQYPLRDLTPEEHERYDIYEYIKYEEYPHSDSDVVGRYWTEKTLNDIGNGCGSVTSMNQALSETYARDPFFYGATYCVHCSKHLPVREFIWVEDGERLGT